MKMTHETTANSNAEELIGQLSIKMEGSEELSRTPIKGSSYITFACIDDSKPLSAENIIIEAKGNIGVIRSMVTSDELITNLFLERVIDTRTI